MADPAYLLVFVTVADAGAARLMGRTMVDEGLAACVQVIPGGTAIYRWQGDLYEEAMTQLVIKTPAVVWPRLVERITGLHTDQVPEVLAVPISNGLPAYLRWMDEVTTAS